ncbi:YdcF family protein [Allochromatium palmeri]|uniref:YdcF family protein n=1 Tax=Allochromatium palmeri TaxID=231048 RepID=A0A6N8ED44_9GAMM|nr:YdcF family protein [Allochromatium palmeri]MTW22152.1 YdcF family protein [Allochromatium palmeri]
MTFYSLFKALLLPPGIIILILIAAVWLTRGVLARLLVFVALLLLTLLSLPVVSVMLIQPLERYPIIGTDQAPLPPEARAIVILSAGVRRVAPEYGSGPTLDDVSLRRVRYGARLQRLTGLPIYVTGGSAPGEARPVGPVMAEVLSDDYGARVAGIESESRTTWENATLTAPLLERDGIHHILLVSDAWHLPRAVEVFERAGLEVTPAPTAQFHHPGWTGTLKYSDWLPSAKALQTSYYAIHEHLGRLWYQVRDWIE